MNTITVIMFETQLTNLIQELNRSTGKKYSLHHWTTGSVSLNTGLNQGLLFVPFNRNHRSGDE